MNKDVVPATITVQNKGKAKILTHGAQDLQRFRPRSAHERLVVLPVGRITCGGHPAITPLLALFARQAGLLGSERITIFQSAFFAGQMPREIAEFVDIRIIPKVDADRNASLSKMRENMVSSRRFAAAVIIGGMEGVFEEMQLFIRYNPRAVVLPIASTGAAAATIYREGQYNEELASDLTFPSLFRRRLPLQSKDDHGR
jgi:SLOG cluster3 family